MDTRTLVEQSHAFLTYLADWRAGLPTLDLTAEVQEPQRVAIISEDLIKGFCTVGPLASPRAQAIVAPAVQLFERAYALGVPHFVLVQDTHDPDAIEFNAYPPHCVRGSEESETIPELATLPFANQFTIVSKNTTHSSLATDFEDWLARHDEVRTFIVVGDCTDICVYQMAIDLRIRANAQVRRDVRVIVPANCVDTYDRPVDAARRLGGLPHAGDLLHLIFLYHMALNGIEIVREVI